jgi:hypothetical protein
MKKIITALVLTLAFSTFTFAEGITPITGRDGNTPHSDRDGHVPIMGYAGCEGRPILRRITSLLHSRSGVPGRRIRNCIFK